MKKITFFSGILASKSPGKAMVRKMNSVKSDTTLVVDDSSVSVAHLRRKVGMVFQNPNVLPFSIQKNFTLPLSITMGLNKRDAGQKAEDTRCAAWRTGYWS